MNVHDLEKLLLAHSDAFHPVVPFNPGTDKLVAFDLSTESEIFSADTLLNSAVFSATVNNELRRTGAKFGIGGYGEHRLVYGGSRIFDAAVAGEEPRRLHLGTDIWGKQGTPVMTPCDAMVHSFAFNNQPGDYGATIILTHALGNSHFYTLYGHLSLNSIKNLQEGDRLEKGDVFAEFGIPADNGGWPPHLHFQLIIDMQNWKGDYPGVCRFTEKEAWLANSPDPDLLLQMNRYLS